MQKTPSEKSRYTRYSSTGHQDNSMCSKIDEYNTHVKALIKQKDAIKNRKKLYRNDKCNKTLPRLLTQDEELSLVTIRKERSIEEQHQSLLRNQINHFQMEKQHCLKVVSRARTRYNSIVETRTQALQNKLQIEKRKQMMEKVRQKTLDKIKARASAEKSQHKTKINSFRDRVQTEVMQFRESRHNNMRTLERNLSNESQRKKLQVQKVKRQQQESIQRKKQYMDTRTSIASSNHQNKILSEWTKTKSYIKQNTKLYKKLITQFQDYKKIAKRANNELEEMKKIMDVKAKKRRCGGGSVPDHLSSCSYNTNQIFVTKDQVK